jgi:NlpC/P60 family putative phage cell wall peptidase
MTSRSVILAEARDWIGTPYMHQASAKGAGCDCLGLVRGVWRALYGAEPEATPAYTPDWAERAGAETLLDAARRHMCEIAIAEAAPGDVLLFRMHPQAPVKHCAILDAGNPPPLAGEVPSVARGRGKLRAAATTPPSVSLRSTAPPQAGEHCFIIHAYWGRAVVRSRFAPWWRARCAAAFSFPDVRSWPS